MLKALAIGFALSTGLVLGGVFTLGGVVYVGAHKFEAAARSSLERMKTEMTSEAENIDHAAPSWADYSDCMTIGTAEGCKPFRPNAAFEAAIRGQSIADYAVDVCNERLDVSMAACINEFFPN